MIVQTVLLLIFSTFQVVQSESAKLMSIHEGPRKNCSRAKSSPIIKSAYTGWPVTLHCQDLYWEALNNMDPLGPDYASYYVEDTINSSKTTQEKCSIWDLEQGKLVFNETFDASAVRKFPFYRVADLQLNSSLKYEVMLSIESENVCISTIIQLEPISLPNVTCSESARDAKTIKRNKQRGHRIILPCEVPDSMNPKLSIEHHSSASVKWFHNCNPIPTEQSNSSTSSKHLAINDVDFKHSGVYTCAVTHNNQIWYTSHYSICVKPHSSYFSHSLVCATDKVFTSFGQKAHFHCKGHVPTNHRSYRFLASWKKENKTLCSSPKHFRRGDCSASQGGCPRYKCAMDLNDPPCFTAPPSEDELRATSSEVVDVHFTIENVTSSDLGGYEVKVTDHFSDKVATARVFLELDHSQALTTSSIGVGAAIGVVLSCFLLFPLIVFCKRRRKRLARRKESIEETMTISESV